MEFSGVVSATVFALLSRTSSGHPGEIKILVFCTHHKVIFNLTKHFVGVNQQLRINAFFKCLNVVFRNIHNEVE